MSARIRFHVITVFPEMIAQALGYGIVSQAVKTGLLEFTATTPRTFTSNVHQTIDDRPFGGGDGMVMLAEPLAQALAAVRAKIPTGARTRVIHLSPRGVPLTDLRARELAQSNDDLILVASRYAGVDQRFLNEFVDEEISLGDFVVSGGELPALVLIDAVARHIPGVLGNDASAETESFAPGQAGGLEFPQFTRPREWRGREVPVALLSGDHARVNDWKVALGVLVTARKRPDLLQHFAQGALRLAVNVLGSLSDEEIKQCGLESRQVLLEALGSRGLQQQGLKK